MCGASMQFQRKNIRLPATNYHGCGPFFITLCSDERFCAFNDHHAFTRRAVEILHTIASRQGFIIHAYCFMPDHLHALVAGTSPSTNLLGFVSTFKQKTTTEFHRVFSRRSLWQKKFYDHILRPNEPPDLVAAYIWMNPVRKGLCEDPRQYPYSGPFTLADRARPNPSTSWIPPWKSAQCR